MFLALNMWSILFSGIIYNYRAYQVGSSLKTASAPDNGYLDYTAEMRVIVYRKYKSSLHSIPQYSRIGILGSL